MRRPADAVRALQTAAAQEAEASITKLHTAELTAALTKEMAIAKEENALLRARLGDLGGAVGDLRAALQRLRRDYQASERAVKEQAGVHRAMAAAVLKLQQGHQRAHGATMRDVTRTLDGMRGVCETALEKVAAEAGALAAPAARGPDQTMLKMMLALI